MHRSGADHISADRGQRLAERSAQKVNLADASLLFGTTQPVFSSHPDSMRFVHIKQDTVILSFQPHQPIEIRLVTIHAENAFCHYNHLFIFGMMRRQQLFQLFIIIMPVTDALCTRKANAVNKAGMHQFIGKNQRADIAHSRQDARVHVIAAAKDQRTFSPEKLGQPFLQAGVYIKITGQQTGRGSRREEAVGSKGLQKAGTQVGICCQPQVIVGREVQHNVAICLHLPATMMSGGQSAQIVFTLQAVKLLFQFFK